MKNLYQTMSDYFKNNPIDWNYYLNELELPKNINDARNFIKDFFAYGGKSYLIHDIIQECEPLRINHTLSVFFIGLLIKNSSYHELNIIDDNQNEIFEFNYLWFLVSLFHDMGYVQEEDWKYKFEYRKKSNDFKIIMKNHDFPINSFRIYHNYNAYYDLGIIYPAPCYFKTNPIMPYRIANSKNNPRPNNRIIFNNRTIITRSMYPRSTVFNYLEYCKMNEDINHYDHGIVGGLWLYDSLVKNYYLSYISLNNPRIDFNDFYVNDLHFNTNQFSIFAYLADCIISHNMWFATDDETIELYEKCGLEQLIPPHAQPIQFDNNPLLFILALADTLEPIKTCCDPKYKLNIEPTEVLKNIECIFNQNHILLLFNNNDIFKIMKDKLDGLENWLNINIEICESANKIDITF